MPSGLSGQTWSSLVPSSVPTSSSCALPRKVQPEPPFPCSTPLSPSFKCPLYSDESQMYTPNPEVSWALTSRIMSWLASQLTACLTAPQANGSSEKDTPQLNPP